MEDNFSTKFKTGFTLLSVLCGAYIFGIIILGVHLLLGTISLVPALLILMVIAVLGYSLLLIASRVIAWFVTLNN